MFNILASNKAGISWNFHLHFLDPTCHKLSVECVLHVNLSENVNLTRDALWCKILLVEQQLEKQTNCSALPTEAMQKGDVFWTILGTSASFSFFSNSLENSKSPWIFNLYTDTGPTVSCSGTINVTTAFQHVSSWPAARGGFTVLTT